MRGRYILRNKNIKFIKYLGIFSILWPIGAVVVSTSWGLSLFSSVPVALGWFYFLYKVLFSRFPRGAIIYMGIFLGLSAILFSVAASSTGEILRSIKTFISPAMFLSVIYVGLIYDKGVLINGVDRNIGYPVFNVALWVAMFGFFEIFFRYYVPYLGDLWYEAVRTAGFSGVDYLSSGYMDWGYVFVGQRPLGLYGDQHTAPLIGVLCACYFALNNKNKSFWLSIVAVMFTFRWTFYIFIPALIYLRSDQSSKLYINLAMIIPALFGLVVIYGYIAEDSSGAVLVEHFLAGLNLFSLSWFELLFGVGYTGDLETDLGFLEVFIFKYISFFGLLGVVYFIFLTVLPIWIFFKRKSVLSKSHSTKNADWQPNHKVYLLLPMVPLIGTIHYNAFFSTSAAFLYAYILVSGLISFKHTNIHDAKQIT